jgi:RNA cap guanine-N2 methyltransferase
MESKLIYKKFGDNYLADENTFVMGIDKRITSKIAERFRNRIILETCTGAGFTTISLAHVAKRVFSIDISETNQSQARHNIKKAGFENKVGFIIGSSLDDKILAQTTNINAAFLDPDWSLSENEHIYRFKNSNTKPASDLLLNRIFRITKNIAIILAPFVNEDELVELPVNEKQKIYLDSEYALICLYFGDLIQKIGESRLDL